jgi:hypothetical protein
MIRTSPSGRWLDRLNGLQRFYDGPIPADERQWIFADPGRDIESAAETWNRLARESAARLASLEAAERSAGSAHARRATADALAAERDWWRHCRDRALATDGDRAPAS